MMSKLPKGISIEDDFEAHLRRVDFDNPDETPMELPSTGVGLHRSKRAATSKLDLTGFVKAVFLVGRGYHGKTVLARKLMEDAMLSGRRTFCAACDPGNRTLLHYFTGITQPPSSDMHQTAKWIEKSLSFISKEKVDAIYDLGAGGDNALLMLLETVPNLVDRLQDWGIVPVMLYVLGPNPDSLVSLTTFEQRRFRPPATALIYNEFLANAGGDKRNAFERLQLQSTFGRATARGAIQIWMPALEGETMAEIERKRFLFRSAAAGETKNDGDSLPIGGFNRARTTRWLEDFDYEFEPIRSWLP